MQVRLEAFDQMLNPLDLNINQALKDLRSEKEAIDATIVALERLLTRHSSLGRKGLAATIAPARSTKRTSTAERKK